MADKEWCAIKDYKILRSRAKEEQLHYSEEIFNRFYRETFWNWWDGKKLHLLAPPYSSMRRDSIECIITETCKKWTSVGKKAFKGEVYPKGGKKKRKEEKRGEKRNTHIFKDHGVKENLKYVLGTLICTKLEGFFDT